MNPDTIGYVWTGEYDLNTLGVDGEIFESATKKLRIRKYPYTCGQGLSDTFRLKPSAGREGRVGYANLKRSCIKVQTKGINTTCVGQRADQFERSDVSVVWK